MGLICNSDSCLNIFPKQLEFFDSEVAGKYISEQAKRISSFFDLVYNKFSFRDVPSLTDKTSFFVEHLQKTERDKPIQQIQQNLTCAQLPIGPYHIGSFATYKERQQNPNQKDIANFTITSASSSLVKGIVVLQHLNQTLPFNASCEQKRYNGFPELKLNITAPFKSGLNNCSGIYNSQTSIFDAVMYLGGPSLTTGDQDYQACQGKRYGVVFP